MKRDNIFRPKGMASLLQRARFLPDGGILPDRDDILFCRGKGVFSFAVKTGKMKKGVGRYEMSDNFDKKDNRIAVVSVLVADRLVSDKVNGFLTEYGEWIWGRMGIPYKEKGVSVLSVVMDAPVEITNALTGKLGRLSGVSVKALFGKI